MLKAVQNSFLSLIYPQECKVCGDQVESLDAGSACLNCWNSTRIFGGSEMLCDKCGAFLGEEAGLTTVFCHKCDDHSYDKANAVGVYEKALAASIISLKSSPNLCKLARSSIQKAIAKTDFSGTDLVVPVPLSKIRRLERGFNQAEIIAAEVGRLTRLPVDTLSLVRKIHTPMHRAGMDQKAREITVKNAFEVLRPKLVKGKNILLIDDVFTSGATSSNCARVLKKNGSGDVLVFTLARAVMQ